MGTLQALPHQLAGDAALAGLWHEFGAIMTRIAHALDALPKNTAFIVRGDQSERFVGSVAVADYKRKFAAVSWTLTDGNFDNGGVGEVRNVWKKGLFGKKKWVSAEQRTNAENFTRYAAQPGQSGLYYLALHETAHVSALGLDTANHCWNMFLQTQRPAAEYPSTEHWRYNEAVANGVVRAISTRAGFPVMASPGGGYVQ